jgi:hypothetical protein
MHADLAKTTRTRARYIYIYLFKLPLKEKLRGGSKMSFVMKFPNKGAEIFA